MKALWPFAFGVALITSCSAGGSGGTAPANVSGSGVSGTGPSQPAVADACGATAGCVTLGHVDVDGDGVLDSVGIAVNREPPSSPNVVNGPASFIVRVVTASGAQETRVDSATGSLPGSGSAQDVFTGAFLISRPKGADLVLHTSYGAGNSDEFAVIGWTDGQLAPVPPPPVAKTSFPNPNSWGLMESHGKVAWVTCDGDSSITVVTQSAPTSEGIPLPGGGIRESDHWRFGNGAWTAMGSENAADDSNPYGPDGQPEVFRCQDQRRS